MAHIFNTGYDFEQAYYELMMMNELTGKYGSPGLVMQAHNSHLLQTQPVRVGYFNALFLLAADVREAVSSVSDEHMSAFTYSTVISSLASKLYPQLQIDWGKFAYASRPNLPSLKDFDSWIDVAVGAEENRGNRFSVPNQRASYTPRQQQTKYVQSGRSGYRQHQNSSGQTIDSTSPGPTILMQSINPETNRLPIPQCSACNESPGHRLDFCNTFKRMPINQRAALVAENNYCFKCLTAQGPRAQGHKCQTCGQAHHTLLHGADQKFPKKKGNISTDELMIRAPPKTKLQPVLLVIVPVIVINGNIRVRSFAILDQGSEATLATQSLAVKLQLLGHSVQINTTRSHTRAKVDRTTLAIIPPLSTVRTSML